MDFDKLFANLPKLDTDFGSIGQNAMINENIQAILQNPPTVAKSVSLEEQLEPIVKNTNETIAQLQENNVQLRNNYEQLRRLYETKQQEIVKTEKELTKSKRINIILFVLTLISTVAAVGAWLFPLK
ncbi:MAG: hypothetical protein IJT65_01395 [Eubacterium sp.]|nr:hypothetical protein [Eubacterium sp.]